MPIALCQHRLPELSNVQSDTCVPLTTAIPGSETAFNFARCAERQPASHTTNSARGIFRLKWDEHRRNIDGSFTAT
ncbi:MAG: hypothetical protein ACLTXH_00265 [Enterobacter hormaechei]